MQGIGRGDCSISYGNIHSWVPSHHSSLSESKRKCLSVFLLLLRIQYVIKITELVRWSAAEQVQWVCVRAHAHAYACLESCKRVTWSQYCIITETKTKFPEQMKGPERHPLISAISKYLFNYLHAKNPQTKPNQPAKQHQRNPKTRAYTFGLKGNALQK